MNVAIDTVVAFVVLYIVIDFVRSYVASTGTTWQRLLATGKQSATILWSRFTILVTGLSSALVWLADYLNAPGVADGIRAVVQPQYMPIIIIFIAVVTEFARRRTL